MPNQNYTKKIHWKRDCTLDEIKINPMIDVSRVLEMLLKVGKTTMKSRCMCMHVCDSCKWLANVYR